MGDIESVLNEHRKYLKELNGVKNVKKVNRHSSDSEMNYAFQVVSNDKNYYVAVRIRPRDRVSFYKVSVNKKVVYSNQVRCNNVTEFRTFLIACVTTLSMMGIN